jgi:hypothetical protein
LIRNVSPAEISVDVLDYPRDMFKMDHDQFKIKPGKMQEVKIELKGDSKGTEFKKSITLEINGEKGSRFTIPMLKSNAFETIKNPGKKS